MDARHGGVPGLHVAMMGLGVTLSQELTGQGVHRGNGAGGCSVDLHEGESGTSVSTPCQRRPVTLRSRQHLTHVTLLAPWQKLEGKGSPMISTAERFYLSTT